MQDNIKAFWLAVITAAIWGSVPIMEKLGLSTGALGAQGAPGAGLAPMAGVIVRTTGSFIAGFVLLGVLAARKSPDAEVFKKPDIMAITALSIAGIFGSVIGQIFFYYALKNGNASLATPVAGSFPLLTFIGGVIFLKEKITVQRVFGVVFIITGVLFIKG